MDRRTRQREGDLCATRDLTLARCTVRRSLERYHLGGRRRQNHNVFCAFRKGRAGDERMHDLIKFFFWLQVASDFTLKLKWVCSADNKDADDLTRPGAVDHVRLEQRCFVCLWEKWGGFDMDLMATGTSVQWILGVGRDADRALPFYSRYHTAGTAGVDVLD